MEGPQGLQKQPEEERENDDLIQRIQSMIAEFRAHLEALDDDHRQ